MSNRILRLRGLPWSATEEDIRTFLGEPSPKEIFLRKRGEKSTGEAFAEYETAEEASEAQEDRNNRNLGERYIEIFVTDADSLQALKNEVQEQDTGWVVRLRGLPFAATPEDVLAFFSGLEVLRGSAGVVFTWGRDGRPLGEAYVEFPSEAVQEEALKRDKEKMGPRYVEIFKSTKADMVMRAALRWQKRGSETGQGASTSQAGKERYRRMSEPGSSQLLRSPIPRMYTQGIAPSPFSLRIRGLPLDATAAEVASLFSDFQVSPDAVEILTMASPSGQVVNTGMANIKFASPAAAEAARQRQSGKRLRSSIIECLPLAPQLQPQPFAGHPALYPAPYMAQGMNPMGMMMGLQDMGRPMAPVPNVYSERPIQQGSARLQGMSQRPRSMQAPPRTPAPENPVFQPLNVPHMQAGLPGLGPPMPGPNPQPGSPLIRGMWGGMGRMSPQPQGPLPAFPATSFQQQQQMLMQQYIMQQQFLQQQAMAQMPQAGWGYLQAQGMGPMPMRYPGSYPGSPLRAMQGLGSSPLQRPPYAPRQRGPPTRPSPPASDISGTTPLEPPSLESLSIASPTLGEPASEAVRTLPVPLSLSTGLPQTTKPVPETSREQ